MATRNSAPPRPARCACTSTPPQHLAARTPQLHCPAPPPRGRRAAAVGSGSAPPPRRTRGARRLPPAGGDTRQRPEPRRESPTHNAQRRSWAVPPLCSGRLDTPVKHCRRCRQLTQHTSVLTGPRSLPRAAPAGSTHGRCPPDRCPHRQRGPRTPVLPRSWSPAVACSALSAHTLGTRLNPLGLVLCSWPTNWECEKKKSRARQSRQVGGVMSGCLSLCLSVCLSLSLCALCCTWSDRRAPRLTVSVPPRAPMAGWAPRKFAQRTTTCCWSGSGWSSIRSNRCRTST